ncbi:organic cation transporter protein-like [Dermatophagoides pteronyssinus]|uniref:organic cation transporter protein-like n=1 Tax=Dermatophagoides pteronyssinus TaxID=6956 RepID=UPI003F66B729
MKNRKESNKTKNIDDILVYLGDIGRYQWEIFLLSILPVFIAGMLSTSFIFTTSIPEYRCFIPACDTLNAEQQPESVRTKTELFSKSFISFTIPMKKNSLKNEFETCSTYGMIEQSNKNYSSSSSLQCLPQSFDNQTLRKCDNYVYNNEYFYSTIVTDYKLHCNDEWFVQLIQSLFFFGVLVGAIVNGILADKYGRRIIFIIYSPITTLCILLSIFAPNLSIYAFSLFIKGICVAGIYQSAFTLGIECLDGKWRFWLGNSYSVIFASGAIYACLCAWWLRSWRLMEISNLFPAIFMLPYPLILSESIRWQFSAGKIQQALRQITVAANKNNVDIPDDLFQSFLIESEKPINEKTCDQQQSNVSIMDLFGHKLIRKWTITFLYIWFTNALVYYGLSFLASDINQNIYLSMVLLMIVEFPGVLVASYLGDFTRKYVLMGIMITGGCSCIISSFLSAGNLKMWLAILGKMSISGSFSLIYVYSAEIFPTILRITGLGMCSFCSRFGAMSAPYLLQLHLFGDSFPFRVIGIITLLAGIVSILLPETKGKKLPDTLAEVEQLKYTNKQLILLLNNGGGGDSCSIVSTELSETDDLLGNECRMNVTTK